MPRRQERTETPGDVNFEHDAVSERILIAAAMVSPEDRQTLTRKFPNTDYFFEPKNKKIWAAILELERKRLAFSVETLLVLGDVDEEYVRSGLEQYPEAPKNLDLFINRAYWDRARMSASKGGPLAQLVEAVRDHTADPNRVRTLAKQTLEIFDGYREDTYIRETDDLILELRHRRQETIDGRAVFPYGINRLDFQDKNDRDGNPIPRMVPGASPGGVTLIVGNSGIGKSTVTARAVLGIARQNRRVLYGAWENTSASTAQALACMALEIDRNRLVLKPDQGGLSEEEFENMLITCKAIGRRVVFMEVPFNRKSKEKYKSNDRNLDIIQEHIQNAGPDVFVADLFQRCLVENKPDEEAHALWRIQSMAVEEQCHMLLVHQARLKDTETRVDKRPTRESIKGTSAWVDVPDTILGIHRAASYKQVTDDLLEIIVLKQRWGRWPIALEFEWNPRTASITGGKEVPYDAMIDQAGGTISNFFETGDKKRRKRGG